MKQQTALDFLLEQIQKHTWYDEEGFPHVSVSILDVEQAKEMEKQQIIDAYKFGNLSDVYYKPEQYYNETYGSEESDETKTN